MSAVSASPAAQGSPVAGDLVRALQHALYRAAKADPGRRFHALYDKVSRSDVLWRAWVAVRSNNGAPGIDKITLAAVEEYGVTRLLGELASELREGRYRPLPARRVLIPKPGTTEQRPLSIPPVRDRIVQAAVKIVLEPVFEADFLPCSFGFRPKRSAHDALQVLIDECWRGRRWVVETDIASCFSAIPHGKLMEWSGSVSGPMMIRPGMPESVRDPLIQRFTAESPALNAGQVLVAIVTGERLGNIALRHDGRAGEVSYWVAAGARGRGVAARALALFSSWSFQAVGLKELWLRAHSENVASQRAALRAGYQRDPGRDGPEEVKGAVWPMLGYALRPPGS